MLQAIFTGVLAGITIIYVCLVYKSLYVNFEAFLRPMSTITSGGGEWTIELLNLGPGIATHIQIKAIVVVERKLKKPVPKYWLMMKNITPDGEFFLHPRQRQKYFFQNLIAFEYPVVLKWRSINGKKQKSFWLIEIKKEGKGIPLYLSSRIRLKSRWMLRWFWVNKKSPYYHVQKLWSSKKHDFMV